MTSTESLCVYTVIGTPAFGICGICIVRYYHSLRMRELDLSVHVVEPSHILQQIHTAEPLQIAEQIERNTEDVQIEWNTEDVQIAESIPVDATLIPLRHYNQEALYI